MQAEEEATLRRAIGLAHELDIKAAKGSGFWPTIFPVVIHSAKQVGVVFERILDRGEEEGDAEYLQSQIYAINKYVDENAKHLGYDSDTFKCLSDYRLCCEREPPILCAALAMICFLQQLIPFAGKK
jgi:hypothetical protein